MGDDASVRRLVELLSAFFTEGKDVGEDLTHSLTSEFLSNMQDILFTKQLVSYTRFEKFLDKSKEEMLTHPELYLQCLFYACLEDAQVIFHIFERFLSAFALILRTSIETRVSTGANFCKLVPDTFMVLYEKELKEPFRRCKGFGQLVKYINNPKYLESKCIMRSVYYFHDHNASINEIPNNIRERALIIMRKERKLPKFENPEAANYALHLARCVLAITKPEFIPSSDDLNASLNDLFKKKTLISVTYEEAPGQIMDNARYENIIEAVIKYNHSKSLCPVKSKDCTRTEADGILEHLKNNIKSLIEILDEECNE